MVMEMGWRGLPGVVVRATGMRGRRGDLSESWVRNSGVELDLLSQVGDASHSCGCCPGGRDSMPVVRYTNLRERKVLT